MSRVGLEGWRCPAGGALALLGLAGALFSAVRPTNFIGSDEWLCLSLLSRGILNIPYGNRPLNLVWGLPSRWLFPDQLAGLLAIHAAWIGLGGVLVFLVVRRLLRGAMVPAFLAGAFTIVWAPSDSTRVASAQMFVYSGFTFGALLTTWLALEAWSRRSVLLAIGGLVAATVAALSHEAALAPLVLLPLLFLASGGRRERRRLAVATLVVFGALGVLGLRGAWPLWTAPDRVSYQAQIQASDLRPVRLAERCLGQLRRHLWPLVEPAPRGARAWPTVPIALAVFTLGLAACSRPAAAERRPLAAVAIFGLLWGILGYLPFVASAQTRGATRTEFLSTPGIAVFLAAVVGVVLSFLPGRARPAVAGLLGAWVVTLGVLRTTAFQADWDAGGPYRDQRRVLLAVTSIAPDVVPGTIVVLLGQGRMWPFDLTFRHAISYLYEGHAVGHVPSSDPFLYETAFEPGGIRSSPIPVIRAPWDEPPRLYPYESVVVVREDVLGRLALVDTWPPDLPPLPSGARYAPRSRILPGPRARRIAILDP
jgi:uncharacterized membrane protein HdeD (DUF308 family)